VLIRLGRNTLTDRHLQAVSEDAFDKWGLFGFSTFGLGDGGYPELARFVPLVPYRQWVMEARTDDLIADGFPLLPSNDYPHWTVVLSEPSPTQFARVRRHFSEAMRNPVWVGRR
jgi:hypothetical protein